MLRYGAAPPGLLPRLLVPALLVVASPPAQAQVRPLPPDPSMGILLGAGIFTPSVTSSFSFSDNLFRVNDTEFVSVDQNGDGTTDSLARRTTTSSLVTEISPRLSYLLPYSNSRLNVSYAAQYRNYSRVTLPAKIAHDLGLQNQLVLSNGMTFDLTGDYLRGFAESEEVDPAEQRAFSTTPFHNRRVSLGWRWMHPGHWGSVVTLDHAASRFLQTQQVFAGPAPVPFFDYRRSGFFLDGTWLGSSELEFYGGVGLHTTDQDRQQYNDYLVENDEQSLGADLDGDGTLEAVNRSDLDPRDRLKERAFRMGVRGVLAQRYSGTAEFGYTEIHSALGLDSGFRGMQMRLIVQAFLSSSSRLAVEMSRQPQQALVDQSETLVSNIVRVAWTLAPGSVHTWTAGFRFLGSDYGTSHDTNWVIDGSWAVRFHRRSQLQVGLQRVMHGSDIPSGEYNEDRVSLNWSFGWF